MREPTTPQKVLDLHRIRRSDPQRYLQIVNEWIRENPSNHNALFNRYQGWMEIGEPQRAIEDLNKVIELKPSQEAFLCRGNVNRYLGEYQKAIEDFARGEGIDSAEWQDDIVIGLLYQADCHAQLGHEDTALAYCARLPEDFWTPGIGGAPAGDKAEIADELRRIAARARRGNLPSRR